MIPKIPITIVRHQFTVHAVIFTIFGLLGFLPFDWLKPHHQLFGLFALAPIINLAFIVFGLALAYSLWLKSSLGSYTPHKRLSQAIGAFYAILAIGGFVSGPHWLNLFPNTIASDILYALIALYYLYLGFFRPQTAPTQPASIDLPPMTQVPPITPQL